MPLAGKTLMPREIADFAHRHWSNYELTKAVATALSESNGSVGAWHDNLDEDGNLISRDCGLMQISIPAKYVGTVAEDKLRTESRDQEIYTQVMKNNLKAAYDLYTQPWQRNGKVEMRRWQPWVGYTTGWATLPAWYTWKHVDGESIGPWIPTGRYIQRAIPGHANYRLLIKKDLTPQNALEFARSLAKKFKVEGTLGLNHVGAVGWTGFPIKPPGAPEDGEGPRPVENNGI